MPPSLHNYDVLEILGSGSFGTCYKVQHTISKDVFVWKAVDYSAMGGKTKELLCSEVTLLSEICNPYIVRYYSHIVHDETSTLYIVMELCEDGDLSTLINEAKKQSWIEEHTIWRVVADVSRALDWLHTHAILHGNVKPSNIFKHLGGSYKVGDFSLAARRRASRNGFIQENFTYQSPEVLKGQIADAKSDIWALGCVAFELSCLTPPFTGFSSEEVLLDITAKRSAEERLNRSVSLALSRVIGWMLSEENRPAASAVARHPSVARCATAQELRCATAQESVQSHAEQKVTSKIPQINSNAPATVETHRRPEEISYGLFRTKWVRRLEDVRGREAQASAREQAVSERERRVASLERRVASLEKRSQRSRSVPRIRKVLVEDEPSYCTAPGDSSFSLTTAARLDPTVLPKPNFPPRVRFRSDSGIESGRESKLSDHESKPVGHELKPSVNNIKRPDGKSKLNFCKSKHVQESKLSGREAKFSGRESKLSGRESKLSGRESKLSGRESKLSGRESKLSEQESKPSNRESKLSNLESKPAFAKTSCSHNPGFCKCPKLQHLPHSTNSNFGLLPSIPTQNQRRKSNLFSGSPVAISRSDAIENEVENPKIKSPKPSKTRKLFPRSFRLYKKKKDKMPEQMGCGNTICETTNFPELVPHVESTVPNLPQQRPVIQNHNNTSNVPGRDKNIRRSRFFIWDESKSSQPDLPKRNDLKCSTLKNPKESLKPLESKAAVCNSFKVPLLKDFSSKAQLKCASLSELHRNDKADRRKSTCSSEPTTNRLSTYLAFGGNTEEEKCGVVSNGPQFAVEYADIEEFNNVNDLSSNFLKVVNLR